MIYNPEDEEKMGEEEEVNDDPLSPKNTERLYGKAAHEDEPRPGDAETIETSLPDAPDDVDENMFPSAS